MNSKHRWLPFRWPLMRLKNEKIKRRKRPATLQYHQGRK